MPRIGIGVPVYNGEQFVAQAIESMLGQTFDDIELVICDNASTDGTEEICRRYVALDRRVRYHRNPVNVGAGPNFNRTFHLTRGEYFKWAACDDLHEPEFLRRCVQVLDTDRTVVLCHAAGTYIDSEGNRIGGYEPDPIPNVGSSRPSVRFRDLILNDHWCIEVFGVIRREVLARTPLIASFVGSDRTLLAELGLLGKFHILPEVLFLSREHQGRSVRSDVRSRGEWFDARLRGRFSLLYWRCIAEYARILARVDIEPRERLAAAKVLGPWILDHHWHLREDLRAGLRHFVTRRGQR